MSIAVARADTDDDGVPDRLGDTLSVAGRVTIGTGVLRSDRFIVFVQDATHGIGLYAADAERAVAAGDSVVVTGVVDQYRGLTQLRLLDLQTVDAPRRRAQPVEIRPEDVLSEAYEGRLVRMTLRIVDKGRRRAGRYLVLREAGGGDPAITLFVSDTQAASVPLDAHDPGDDVEVTGILGQYDYEPPYRDAYQIYVRRASDLRQVSLTRATLRRIGYALFGTVLVALAIIMMLRRQVRRRTRDLEESEARYRTVVAHVPVVLFALDPTGRFTFVEGRALENLVGSETDLVGRSAFDVYGTHPGMADNVRRVLRGESRSWMLDVGGQFYEIHGTPLRGGDGDVRGMIGIAIDLTDRLRHEAELVEAKEQAEEMSRLKTTFLANMSHEIRTPLTGILGFAEVLADEATGDFAEFADMIVKNGYRLMETLNSVLDLAQLESRTMRLNLARIDVAEQVREAVALFAPRARQQALYLRFEAPERPVHALLDVGALHRILSNLISNALKFTSQGGITVTMRVDEKDVALAVRDTGIGIDAMFLPHLFDEFRQESSGLSRNFEGNGLGLAITRHLVEMMRGSITASSAKGEGSTFVVRFPLDEPAAVAPEKAPAVLAEA